jgi:hypothetical protein
MFRLNRGTVVSFAGLLTGIAGLVIQWIANPARFGGFPPGIAFIAGAGLLALATSRWWWHPVFGVLISLWIVVGGAMADQMQPNLVSSNLGTVAGTVVMALGLIVAAIAGVVSMITARRSRKPSVIPER